MYRNVFGHEFNKEIVIYVRSLNTSMLIYTLFSTPRHPEIDIHSPYTLPYSYTPASQPKHPKVAYVVYTPWPVNSNSRVYVIALDIRNSYLNMPTHIVYSGTTVQYTLILYV